MLPRENLKSAGFWHSGRMLALLQMPPASLHNLKEFFGDPSFIYFL